MNAPFLRPIVEPSYGTEIIAAAWRGACLELYSRGEAAVDECLAKLRRAGWQLDKASEHPGAKTRLVALRKFVSEKGSGPHNQAAIDAISVWSELAANRLLLAHGMIGMKKGGIVQLHLDPHTPTTAEETPLREITQIEMAADLKRLECALHKLKCQLGSVANYRPDLSKKAAV